MPTPATADPGTVQREDAALLNALLKRLVSKRALTQADFDTVIEITNQKVVDAIHAEAITIFVKEERSIRFANIYYAEALYEGNPELRDKFRKQAETLQKMRLNPGQGIVGRVIQTGKAEIVKDAQSDPNFDKSAQKETGFATRSMLTVPLKADGETIGAIQTLNKRAGDGKFTEHDLALLEEVATYSARMILRIRNPEKPVDDKEAARYIAKLTRHPLLEIDEKFEADEKLLKLIGEPVLRRFNILPLKKTSTEGLEVAMANPLDLQKRDSFQVAAKLRIEEVRVAPESAITTVIDRFFKPHGELGDVSAKVLDQLGIGGDGHIESISVDDGVDEESAPIVQLASKIIEDAYARGASDIHVEPFEKEVQVRYRVDGALAEVLRLPIQANRALVSRLKIMSELDISERRLPQDGRIQFKKFSRNGVDIDLRVSTAPVSWGEKVVMRILDKSGSILGLEQMGFSPFNLNRYRNCIQKPYGMILHVGPTGSGKTTTLYSALNEINKPDINIQTAEDPIEYQLRGVNQMQMHPAIGLNFSRALRCFLRQDPDVILVGEIRDEETAEIGIEAALTGHLLFSTMHTNDAAGTVARFTEMGIEPFLISSSLLCICAQRLMRRLCKKCKEAYQPTAEELRAIPGVEWEPGITLYRHKGCPACNGTGFKGRTGVHELLTLTEPLKQKINEKAPAEVIKQVAIQAGMITLYLDALDKVRQGVSSLDEAVMTVRSD